MEGTVFYLRNNFIKKKLLLKKNLKGILCWDNEGTTKGREEEKVIKMMTLEI